MRGPCAICYGQILTVSTSNHHSYDYADFKHHMKRRYKAGVCHQEEQVSCLDGMLSK